MLHSVQKTNVTVVGKKMRSIVQSDSTKWLQSVRDTKYYIRCIEHMVESAERDEREFVEAVGTLFLELLL